MNAKHSIQHFAYCPKTHAIIAVKQIYDAPTADMRRLAQQPPDSHIRHAIVVHELAK